MTAAAVAVVILAALALVEARAGDVAPAAYLPTIVNWPAGNCDSSYPTVCIPPRPPDLDCPEVLPRFNFQVFQPDPHGFDRDKDGRGCEEP